MIESTQRSVARSRPEIGRRVHNRMPDRIRLAAKERLLQFTALGAPCHRLSEAEARLCGKSDNV